MGRYVGDEWHEELPSGGSEDQQQGYTGGGEAAPAGGDMGVQSGVSGGEWKAADGQTLNSQSIQTQQDFLAIYGDQAGQAWANEHNAALGAGPATQTAGAPATAPATKPATPGAPPVQPGASQYGAAIQSMLNAIASGNREAFQRAVYEFDVTFQLDKDKFAEDTRRFNENFGITQAGMTGTYQGQATLPALTSYANQFGTWGVPQQGATTLAAQQQAYAQQMGMINQAATLQANPFRQQQVIGQMGGLLQGGGVAGFQAPNTVAGVGTQGGNMRGGMGYLQQMIDDIRDPSANSASMSNVLGAIPTPNKLNSTEFLRSAPSTQSMVLQGMQEKYGLDPSDSLKQIQNTLPQFNAPTTAGGVRR